MSWEVRLDAVCHWLHVPRFVQWRVCDWLDRRLGVPETALRGLGG